MLGPKEREVKAGKPNPALKCPELLARPGGWLTPIACTACPYLLLIAHSYPCTCGLCAGFLRCGGGPLTTLTSNSTVNFFVGYQEALSHAWYFNSHCSM